MRLVRRLDGYRLGDLYRMRLPANFQASLQKTRERQFDRDIAVRLAARYLFFAARDEQFRVDWVTDRRRWLARIGVTTQQHVLDHLEIMVVHGNRVIDDPAYRAIMTRPFRSQEEKAVSLRRHFLMHETAKVAHG